jgi:hypothetical protein
LACVIFFEAQLIFLFVLDAACDTGREAIATVLNTTTHQWTSVTSPIREVEDALGNVTEEVWPAFCDITEKSKDGALLAFVGSVCFICGQFIIALYWMKYSTLALASSFHAQPLGTSLFQMHSVVVPMADAVLADDVVQLVPHTVNNSQFRRSQISLKRVSAL